jgi:hypothetical protein
VPKNEGRNRTNSTVATVMVMNITALSECVKKIDPTSKDVEAINGANEKRVLLR